MDVHTRQCIMPCDQSHQHQTGWQPKQTHPVLQPRRPHRARKTFRLARCPHACWPHPPAVPGCLPPHPHAHSATGQHAAPKRSGPPAVPASPPACAQARLCRLERADTQVEKERRERIGKGGKHTRKARRVKKHQYSGGKGKKRRERKRRRTHHGCRWVKCWV
eukprot:1157634-Pelagomonas_calceolata.AAC.4